MSALRTALVAASAAAAVLVAAAPAAEARTVAATVIAPAAGQHPQTLPVLLSRPAARAYGRPVLRVVVGGRRPVRWGSDRLALAQLRPGDHLGLRLDGRRARSVKLRGSGRADSFARVTRELMRTARSSRGAVAELQRITGGEASDRRRVRRRLSDLMARFMGLEGDLGTTLARMRAVRPDAKARGKAVARVQRPYARRIERVRRQAGAAARRTRAALTAIGAGPPLGEAGDGTLVPVRPGGGGDLPQLPGVISTVGNLSQSIVDLLVQLGVLEPQGLLAPTPPAG